MSDWPIKITSSWCYISSSFSFPNILNSLIQVPLPPILNHRQYIFHHSLYHRLARNEPALRLRKRFVLGYYKANFALVVKIVTIRGNAIPDRRWFLPKQCSHLLGEWPIIPSGNQGLVTSTDEYNIWHLHSLSTDRLFFVCFFKLR